MIEIRLAKKQEAEECYSILDSARAYHKSLGFTQWGPNYPTLEIVKQDIVDGIGYAITNDGILCGYCAITFDGDPEYDKHPEIWLSNGPYMVIHRTAFSNAVRGKGLFHQFFTCAKQIALEHNLHSIKVDTQDENKVMQHLFDKEGLKYCGPVFYDGPKRGYEIVF